MARPELGTKRVCPTTGRKFYDLNQNPVVSPYSGEVVPIAAATGYSRVAAPVVARKEAPAEEDEETEGPELVSLDEVEAEEADKDIDADAEGDDALSIEDDDETVQDDTLVVDEDDDDATELVEVNDDDEE